MRSPKLTINEANQIRRLYKEGASINRLCKKYDLARNSVKSILKGETYNKWGEHENLRPKKDINTLF